MIRKGTDSNKVTPGSMPGGRVAGGRNQFTFQNLLNPSSPPQNFRSGQQQPAVQLLTPPNLNKELSWLGKHILPKRFVKLTVHNEKQPLLEVSPLKEGDQYVFIPKYLKEGLINFLQGQVTTKELLFIKNFPGVYQQLPSPKLESLRSHVQEQAEREKEDAKSPRKSFFGKGFRLGTPVEASQPKLSGRNSPAQNARMLGSMGGQPNSSFHSQMQSSSRSKGSRGQSFAIFQQALKDQSKLKIMKQHIDNGLRKLKKVVKTNIRLRKMMNSAEQPGSFGGKQTGGLIGQINQNIENACHSSSVQSLDPNEFKASFVQKAFKNVSLIHEKKERNETEGTVSRSDLKNEFQILKPLYRRFFSENAEHYLQSIKDPLNPKYRQLLVQSDFEFNKLVQDYANKEKKYQEKLKNKEQRNIQNQLGDYIRGGISNFGFRKRIPNKEKIFSTELEDLDNYNSQHMIANLRKFDRGEEIRPEKKIKPAHLRVRSMMAGRSSCCKNNGNG